MGKSSTNWLVCVRCHTYNHEKYILDALNGFTIQNTNFPYVCCIIDDASKDDEQLVIKKFITDNFVFDDECLYKKEKEYGTLIYARHKTNSNCYFAVVLLKKNHNGTPELQAKKRSYISKWEKNSKYEALCEGDDYWTDTLKLQKQVDFLESHPDVLLSYGRAAMYNELQGKVVGVWGKEISKLEDMFDGSYTPTLTAVVRADAYWRYYEEINPTKKGWLLGDMPLWIWMVENGKINFINEQLGVYRILSESACHSKDLKRTIAFRSSKYDVLSFFCKRYDKKIPASIFYSYAWNRFFNLLNKGAKKQMVSFCRESRQYGFMGLYLSSLMACLMPKRVGQLIYNAYISRH